MCCWGDKLTGHLIRTLGKREAVAIIIQTLTPILRLKDKISQVQFVLSNITEAHSLCYHHKSLYNQPFASALCSIPFQPLCLKWETSLSCHLTGLLGSVGEGGLCLCAMSSVPFTSARVEKQYLLEKVGREEVGKCQNYLISAPPACGCRTKVCSDFY